MTVTPTNASGEYTTLTLTAKPNPSARTTVVEARADTQTGTLLTTLNVQVYNRKTIELCVHKINGFAGAFDFSGVNDILKQAVLFTKSGDLKCEGHCTPTNFPLNITNTVDAFHPFDEDVKLRDACHRYSSKFQQDFYLLPNSNPIMVVEGGVTSYPAGIHSPNNFSVCIEHVAQLYAHELFHSFQGPHTSNDFDNLMKETITEEDKHLIKTQWDSVNP